MKEETLAVIRAMQDNEATDKLVYEALAKQATPKNREILRRMADDEAAHSRVWGRYTGAEARPDTFKVWRYALLGKLFGLVFVINLLESGEDKAAGKYATLLDEVPEARGIMADETRHHDS